jgi:uncharacterized protein YggT (Ycf19 family)
MFFIFLFNCLLCSFLSFYTSVWFLYSCLSSTHVNIWMHMHDFIYQLICRINELGRRTHSCCPRCFGAICDHLELLSLG